MPASCPSFRSFNPIAALQLLGVLGAFILLLPLVGATEIKKVTDVDYVIVRKQSAKLLADLDYEKLEAMGSQLLKDRVLFADGRWELTAFMDGMADSDPRNYGSDQEWNTRIGAFTVWHESYPQSQLAIGMLARTWINYAWVARGHGSDATVTEEGARLFKERIQKAQDLLASNAQLMISHPLYHLCMLRICASLRWPKETAAQLFESSVKTVPGYHFFYFEYMKMLSQSTYFDSNYTWHDFALEAGQARRPGESAAFYARIVWARLPPSQNANYNYALARTSWTQLKASFEVLMQEHPDSLWNKTAYCYFAVKYKDRDTAARLFTELQGTCYLPLWTSQSYFEQCEHWAFGQTENL